MSKMRRAVGAHYGLSEWVAQLLTAVVMLVLLVYLVGAWLVIAPSNFSQLQQFVTTEYIRVPAMVFVLALIWHAWIGGKSVIIDYLSNDTIRLIKITGLACYLVACIIWAASIFWGTV